MVRLTFEMNTVALRRDEEETKRTGVEANRILGESRVIGEVEISEEVWNGEAENDPAAVVRSRAHAIKLGIEKFLQDWQDVEFIQQEAQKIADGNMAPDVQR